MTDQHSEDIYDDALRLLVVVWHLSEVLEARGEASMCRDLRTALLDGDPSELLQRSMS